MKNTQTQPAPAPAIGQHTPGPFQISNTYPEPVTVRAVKSCDGPVKVAAFYHSASYDARNNARLFAAAPQLLDALRAVLPFVPNYVNQPDGEHVENPVLNQARAALALAEGRVS